MIQSHTAGRARQIGLAVLFGAAALLLTLFGLQLTAEAGNFSSGAGNCGDFDQSIALSSDDDTIMQMAPDDDTNGAVISKSLRLSGGWTPSVNCEENNQFFSTTADFLDYGFLYSPTQRSVLLNNNSILNFDLIDEQLVVENIAFDGLQGGFPTADNGGGILGVISDSTEALLDNTLFTQHWADSQGGGIKLIVDAGSHLTLEDGDFTNNRADDNGGGVYVDVRNGSRLTIDRALFADNEAGSGGGFEIHVDATSELVIQNSTFEDNRTITISDDGGGGYLVINGGRVTIRNAVFLNNDAGRNGGGLYVEMNGGELLIENTHFTGNEADTAGSALYVSSVGSEDAALTLRNTRFQNNGPAGAFQTSQSSTGTLDTTVLDETVYLPVTGNGFEPALEHARILSITLDEDYNYQVYFDTNFETNIPGVHVHFFFDTVAPENSGSQGTGGTWILYDGPSPFTGYAFADRPYGVGDNGAEKMCILVADPDHSTRLNTGNCVELP